VNATGSQFCDIFFVNAKKGLGENFSCDPILRSIDPDQVRSNDITFGEYYALSFSCQHRQLLRNDQLLFETLDIDPMFLSNGIQRSCHGDAMHAIFR